MDDGVVAFEHHDVARRWRAFQVRTIPMPLNDAEKGTLVHPMVAHPGFTGDAESGRAEAVCALDRSKRIGDVPDMGRGVGGYRVTLDIVPPSLLVTQDSLLDA